MTEYGVSGLDWIAGNVLADPNVELRGKDGVDQFDLMRLEDPTVSAVLLALELPVREAKWRVNPASDTPQDRQAAEFVEQCMSDMDCSWDDVLTEACTMFPFGWAYMEWVLKRRKGQFARTGPISRYSDGRIGFHKIALRAQTSLFEWDFDVDTGEIKGMLQELPMGVSTSSKDPYLYIPMKKAVLFRTTRERNNPEGRSILRSSHRSWKFKRNLERIEAIGLQRALMGTPVMKFTEGYTTIAQQGRDSDEQRARDIMAGLHNNKQIGLIEDEKMEFRYETPDMQGITGDSTRVIQRYDEAIARATLAMYILLGTRERGSYALATELSDLFFLAVEGYINMIAETFSRWAVPVLFRYNVFPGVTEYPEVTTAINRRVDLEALGKFINATVGAAVIVPDDDLERAIREWVDFPPKPLELLGQERSQPKPGGESQGGTEGPPEECECPKCGYIGPKERGVPCRSKTCPKCGAKMLAKGADPKLDQDEEDDDETESSSPGYHFLGDIETFRQMAGSNLNAYHAATDAYADELSEIYVNWINDAGESFSRIPEGRSLATVREHWEEILAVLLLLLKKKSWARMPEAVMLGYGSRSLPPHLRDAMQLELRDNDDWLSSNLLPSIQKRLTAEDLNQITIMIWAGRRAEAIQYLEDALIGKRAHVRQYSGHYWRLIWFGAIGAARDADLAVLAVKWNLDVVARHCPTCLIFGDREYVSFDDLLNFTGGILPGIGTDCDGNCRCWLTYQATNGNWHEL